MRARWGFVPLAVGLLLSASVLAAAQTGDPPTVFLPLILNTDNMTPAPPVVQVDSQVAPPSQEIAPVVAPYSLRGPAAPSGITAVDVRLPPLDVEKLLREDQAQVDNTRALRIGVVRELPQAVSAAGAGSPGHWQQTADGGRYWTLTIESPGAKAIRVHLEHLSIPPGGHIMVYNAARTDEVYGPYRHFDLYGYPELWTASVFGPVVTVEYYEPPDVVTVRGPDFSVTEVSHAYADVGAPVSPYVFSCHNDVTCYSAWAAEAGGVAGLGTINQGAWLWCSGVLLNDFDDATWVGYFLTANHCLSGNKSDLGTQADANTIEYYWFYQTPTCNGTPPDLATVPRTATGADLISVETANAGNDRAVMRIRGALPGGLWYLGWTTASFSNGDDATGIHHPDGSHKRISFSDISSSDSNYWEVTWSNGTTEPGSSGSPIFDSDHRIRGAAFAMNVIACPGPNTTVHTYYGRYNVTYPYIRRWMEIGGTINANSSYTGAEEGTPTKPFRTTSAANNFAWNDASH